jgi:hypothetical protein
MRAGWSNGARAMELETDEKGLVTFLPLVNWSVTLVQEQTVGVAIDYYASAEDLAARKTTRLQLNLDPGAAQAFGRALTTRSEMLIAAGGAKPPPG